MLLLQVVAMATMQALKFGTNPPDVFAVRSSVQQSFVGGMVTGSSQPQAVIARRLLCSDLGRSTPSGGRPVMRLLQTAATRGAEL